MLLASFFVGYVLADAAVGGERKEDTIGIEGLRIVAGKSVAEAVRNMEGLATYVVEDLNPEDEKINVEHDGRLFVISGDVDGVSKAVNLLKKYPAPTEEVIGIMKSGGASEETNPGNFVVYFLEASGFETSIPNSRNATNVFVSTDASLAETSNVSFPGMCGYNGEDNLVYTLPFTQENARRILPLSALSTVGFTTLGNSALYQSLDVKLFYIFFDIEHSEEIKKSFSGILGEFRYDMKVLLVPNLNQHIKISQYGLSEADLPGCVSIHEDGGKFIQKNVSADNIGGFIRDVLEGRMAPFYNSQEEPEDNDSRPVKVITRNNIQSYMDDTSRDRLLVFGTSKCPHCVMLKPALDVLGGIVKTYASDKVTIGYCDVEENDMNNLDIRFVPTLLLYRAGSNESVPYSGGERSFESLAAFIHESGGLGVDLTRVTQLVNEETEERAMPDVEEARKAEL